MDKDADYYRILLVAPEAPGAIIETSYRTLKQRLRARPGSIADEALLDEAYRVLSDPERRAAFDLARDVAASQRAVEPAESQREPDLAESQSESEFATTGVLDPDAERYAAHRCLF